jgi:hypothetical protein
MFKNKLNRFFSKNASINHFIWFVFLFLFNVSLSHAGDKHISPKNVLSVVTADWNEDGSFDRAVLALSESDPDETELFIYLSNTLENSLRLAVYRKNIAWAGGLWGTLPSLETNKKGSLIVTSTNDSIGRNRWTQKLTIIYKNNMFVVAGYTYVAYDTLDPKYRLNCDVNLLTGRGEKNGKSFKSSSKVANIADWSDAFIPKECQQ